MTAEQQVIDGLPAHYFDCERFNVTNYGTRQGKCDCTATEDVQRLLDLLTEFRKRDEAATRVIERFRGTSQDLPPEEYAGLFDYADDNAKSEQSS